MHIGATGFLGVELSAQGSSGFGGFGGQSTGGIAVEGVLSGSPSAAAGLSQGDVITSVAGQSVSSPSNVESVIEQYHPGDKVSVGWTDGSGQSHTSTVTLAGRPTDSQATVVLPAPPRRLASLAMNVQPGHTPE